MVAVKQFSVAERLSGSPAVREAILAAAAGARGLAHADARAMSHSWLFTGPPGSGRTLAALDFAAALLCTSPVTGHFDGELGCGQCQVCRSILYTDPPSHGDVVFLQPQELSISVDKVRGIIGQAASRPTLGRWRVIIFDNADRLTDGAANALLKTVEEPTDSTVIIMCAPSADPEDFSQTLRSRCRHLYIPAPSADFIVSTLMAEGASESDARLAAATSMRHIGRARHLINSPDAQRRRAIAINLAEDVFHGSQAFIATARLIKEIEKDAKSSHAEQEAREIEKLEVAYGAGGKGKGAARGQRDVKAAVKELEKLHKLRATRRQRNFLDLVLIDLAGIYRDALILRAGAEVELTHPDFAGLAGDLAAKLDDASLTSCLAAISTCREHINYNVNQQVAFDGLIGRLRLACRAK